MSPVSCISGSAGHPTLPVGHLPRPHLIQTLLGSHYRLRLLCAPAGSGKSRLLQECAQRCPADAALHWLAFKGEVPVADALVKWLADAIGLAGPNAADGLRLHLARQRTPLWLMLDDVPLGYDRCFDEVLGQLVQHSSAEVSWWIGTRRRPAWPLARLLLDEELCELGAVELALKRFELEQVLAARDEVGPPTSVEHLLEQTGGWYAGVQLMLLEATDIRHRVREPGGCLIRSYIERELLDHLSVTLIDALCTLACLPRFDAGLCAHVLQREEGAGLIRTLQENGAFIETLDVANGLYRVQPAVARALTGRLEGQVRRRIHRSACQYCSAQNQIVDAIDHALLAGQSEVAASLLERLDGDRLLCGDGLPAMTRWRSQLPAELLTATPRLLILNAWSFLLGANLDQVEAVLARLSRFLPQANAERQAGLLAHAQALEGMVACRRGWTQTGREQLRSALDYLAHRAWGPRLLVLVELIEQACAQGRADEARDLRKEALRLAQSQGSVALEGLLLLQQTREFLARGALEAAQALLQQLCNEPGLPRHLAGQVQLHRGRLLADRGDLKGAGEHFQAAVRLCREADEPGVVQAYIRLAELELESGEYSLAGARLAEAERLMQRRGMAEPRQDGVIHLLRGCLWWRRGEPARAARLAHEWLQVHCASTGVRPVSPELSLRFELLEARACQAMGEDMTRRLERLRIEAERRGWTSRLCEIQIGLAEAYNALGRRRKAQAALLDGLALARRVGLAGIERYMAGDDALLKSWISRGVSETDEDCTHAALVQLSRRELAVLRLIAEGLTNQEIAEQLHISLHTVKSHAQHVSVKLGVSRRTQAILRAKTLGLVS